MKAVIDKLNDNTSVPIIWLFGLAGMGISSLITAIALAFFTGGLSTQLSFAQTRLTDVEGILKTRYDARIQSDLSFAQRLTSIETKQNDMDKKLDILLGRKY